MCPVFCRRNRFDASSEVYSFGVLLLELFTGQLQMGGDQRGIDLVDEVVEEGTLAAHRDTRAGAWAQAASVSLEQLSSACVSSKPVQRPSMVASLRTLNSLVRDHCTPTPEESLAAAELAAAHAELSRARVAADVAAVERVGASRACCLFMACPDAPLTLKDGVECSQGGHFVCNGCLAAFVEDQAGMPPGDLAR